MLRAAVAAWVAVGAARGASFDVASIKPAAVARAGGEGSNRSRIEYSPVSLTMWNVTLADCVQWAYAVRFYQVSGPDSARSDRYDIQAKTGDPVAVGDLRVMLGDLLATRLGLRVRQETKAIPVYELVAAKGGPKLPKPKTEGAVVSSESLPRIEDGGFVFLDTTMGGFAEKLSDLRGIDLPVVDRTGIAGVFDIRLKHAAEAILRPEGPSLFTLIQEQLGLMLVAGKAPVEVVVIDRAGKPTGN